MCLWGLCLEHFSKHVKRMLGDEIVRRFHGQRGEITYSLRDDIDLEESFRLLNDREKYNSILIPANTATADAAIAED